MDRGKPPDGGYGWLVVVAAFMAAFLVDGTSYSFGLMLNILVDEFEATTASVAAISGMMLGIAAVSSHIAGSLSDAFGRRYVTLIGAGVFSTGLFASAFATSVSLLYVTFGVCGGVGFGFLYIPPFASVMEHFSERRGLAVGIALCGSGVGSFIMNMCIRQLLERYGWRGTFLLLSGIMLNGFVCAFILPARRFKDGYMYQPTNNPVPIVDDNQDCNDITCTRYLNDTTNVEQHTCNDSICTSTCLQKQDCNDTTCTRHIDDYASLQKQNCNDITCTRDINDSTCLQKQNCNDTTFMCTRDSNDSTCIRVCTFFKNTKHTLSTVFLDDNLAIFRDLQCLAFLLSAFFLGLGHYIPNNFLPRQALYLGMTLDQAAWLPSTIGITNTISRVGCGWLGTRPSVNRNVMLKVIVLLLAVSFIVSLLLTTFPTKLIFAATYGTLFGGYMSLVPVALADAVSIENVGKTTGLFSTMILGACVFGTPLAGWTIDVTGNFYVCFMVGGAECLLSVMFLMLPQVRGLCSSRAASQNSLPNRDKTIMVEINHPT